MRKTEKVGHGGLGTVEAFMVSSIIVLHLFYYHGMGHLKSISKSYVII